jgi:hypothetical protein
MHRGPLLAYLLADPELSLQSILITNSVIGKKKTAVYVVLVTIFSTLAGLLFGMWVNGVSVWVIALILLAGIAALALASAWINRRHQSQQTTAAEAS